MPPEETIDLGGREAGLWTGSRGIRPGHPALLLIHGSGGSRLSWRPQIRGLDREINVAALDLPGHGLSTGPPAENLAGCVSFLRLALKKLDSQNPFWNRPYFLGGASLGGAVALETALDAPESLAGLILISTGARLSVTSKLICDLKQDYAGALENLAALMHAPQVDPALVRQTRQLLIEADPQVMLSDLKVARDFDRQSRLSEIKLPTLVVYGAEDQLLPLEAARELSLGIPGARLEIIDRAGHLVTVEQHREINRAILDFVQANYKLTRSG